MSDRLRPKVSDLASLGLCSGRVIILGFDASTGFVGGPHIVELIRTPKFQGPDMLHDPPITYAIDRMATDHTDSARPFPYLQSAMPDKDRRGVVPTSSRTT